jgi:hypothetical protein
LYLNDISEYLSWLPFFEAYAATLNALEHLEGEVPEPAQGGNAAAMAAHKKWEKGHDQASLILFKFIGPKLRYVLERADPAVQRAAGIVAPKPTAAERWAALRDHCIVADSATVMRLHERLESIEHNPKNKVYDVIAEVATVTNQCRVNGHPSLQFNDHDQAIRLLRILCRDPKWRDIVEAILATETPAHPLTLNFVESRLKAMQQQRDDIARTKPSAPTSAGGGRAAVGAGGGGDDDQANVVHALLARVEALDKKLSKFKTFGNGGASGGGDIYKCFNCGADGHKSRDCDKPCGRKLTDGTKCGNPSHTSGACTNDKRANKK